MILRQYQLAAIEQARAILDKHWVVYLAAECRTGKTPMALTLAFQVAGDGRVMFVTPKASIPSIEADSKALGCQVDRLAVMNLESLKKANGEFAVVVLDESHRAGGYPRPGIHIKTLELMARKAKRFILLSGTPSVESSAQLFHQFWWTHQGPWKMYSRFYGWHRDFGVPKKIRVAGGREANDYSEMRPEVLDHVRPYVVTVTQEEAGFQFAPEVVVHRIEPSQELMDWSKKFARSGVSELRGHTVVAEGPAASLQKRHMAEGGTLLDEQGEAFTHDMDSLYKIRYMIKRMVKGQEYAVFTCYIAERSLIAGCLRMAGHKVVDELEEFVPGCGGVFVGSGISNAEGVNLAWMTGSMIIYSLNWSGAKWLQVLERQNNFLRDRPIKVHILLCKGGVDEMVFEAVSQKKNFNASFYRSCR